MGPRGLGPFPISGATWPIAVQLNIGDVVGHCRWEHTCIYSGRGRIGQVADGALCCPNSRLRTALLPLRKRSTRAERGPRVATLAFVRS